MVACYGFIISIGKAMSLLLLLPDIFIHYDRGSNTDIKTFHTAKLGNTQALDIGIIEGVKTDAETLIAENEGAFLR